MHLEIEKGHIPDQLYDELGFSDYLQLFVLDVPLLTGRLLRPMGREEGLAHFKALAQMEAVLDDGDVSLLFGLCCELPNLDRLLPAYEQQTLEQYHLFELGRFLEVEQRLASREKNFSLEVANRSFLGRMVDILKDATRNGYSAMREGDGEKSIRIRIENIESRLKTALARHEERIVRLTGLKMIYPYPRELVETPGENILSCPFVTVRKEGAYWLVEHSLEPDALRLVKERDELEQLLEERMACLLAGINDQLLPYFEQFSACYTSYKKRAYRYLLLSVKMDKSLCLPQFVSESGCSVTQGVMPVLRQKKNRCVPLDIDMQKGANVLYGSHMSGKTTVLKTLYFFLSLIRVGLPVPAGAIRLNYPEELSIMLRSSGDLQQEISSFAEELTFFAKERKKGAFVFVDELFLSTDPVNGARLSDVFIREFTTKDMVFLCTTHYPTVLDIADITLLKMVDCHENTLATVCENMPYRVKKITDAGERNALKGNSRPLEIALLFPFSEDVKEKIRKRIDS